MGVGRGGLITGIIIIIIIIITTTTTTIIIIIIIIINLWNALIENYFNTSLLTIPTEFLSVKDKFSLY